MKRARLVADVSTPEEAKRLEETVKTGFVDASIETLVQWIAVEEDLASSYEKISATADSKEFRETADKLRAESLEMQKVLGQMVKELDNLDKESVKRIERLQRLLS